MNQTTGDHIKLKNGLIIAFLMVLSVFLGYFAVRTGFLAVGFLIPAVGLASWMFGRPSTLLVFVMFLSMTKLIIPGLPDVLSISNLYLMVLIVWAMLDAALKPQKRLFSYNMGTDIWLMVFLLNIFLIISIRGFGMGRLGGTVYGGAAYIAVFLGIMTFFSIVRISLTNNNVKNILWAMLIGSMVPAVTELLVYFFEGQAWWLTQYVDLGAVVGLLTEKFKQVGGVERWESLGNLAFSLIPVAYILCKKKHVRFLLLALVFLLIGMTGFRSRMVRTGMLVFIFSMYYSKDRGKTFLFWVVMGIAGVGLLVIIAPYLPLAMQRTVSFLPFIEVDEAVQSVATSSLNWRFELWRNYCLPNIPKYLLVGRGLAHDIAGFAWLADSWYASGEFFYQMGRYHSGPFSLLLDFGLIGTISFTVFFMLFVRDGWATIHRYKLKQRDSLVAQYYIYLTILMSYELFAFFFIFGDVYTMLLRFVMIVAQMRMLKKNFLLEPVPAETESINRLSEGQMPDVSSETNDGNA